MSAERSTSDRSPAEKDLAYRQPDMGQLRARRRDARRRRRLARVDLGLGVLIALVLLLATAGLAIAGLIAIVILVLCGISVWLERRRARAASGHPPRTLRQSAMALKRRRGASDRAPRDRTRSTR